MERLIQIKNNRDSTLVSNLLNSISASCKNGDNLVPPIIDAVKNYCTMGEIVEAMKLEFGEWTETSVF